MEIDLHGLTLEEARNKLFNRLSKLYNSSCVITIIHGHKHGTILKNYIESNEFIAECEEQGIFLIRKTDSNPGSSKFSLENSNMKFNSIPTLGDFLKKY